MKPPLIFIIILAVIVVLATRQFIKQRREVAVNETAPVRLMLVEVKARQAMLMSDRRTRQREVIPVEEMRYEAWFHPLNGEEDFRLILEEKDYNQIDTDSRGELKVQGSRFISFTRVQE